MRAGLEQAPRAGRRPRFCSDACKQAAWRDRLGTEEYNRRRREADELERRRHLVRGYHAELAAITARTPLPVARVLPLLRELAGASPFDERPAVRLYMKAALRWHPDKPTGDKKVFQLLQEAHHTAKLLSL
ncbi:J domain-containing protein (plasmid) [Streptosporangium sp. NBC_01495]|uniref:hypothetical protein n=1 Tax=Streptosporangium sp. NBC_01495 TaxID=2903899 RepID=UPI002E355438|nr:hypothetical protein [Streptosporangium sp. NBC_01495]